MVQASSIEAVAAIRAQLWESGFRPVPVLNSDKAPLGRDWGNAARKDPPDGVRFQPVPHALNTGLLADGLRAIDIDIDDTDLAVRVRSIVVGRFGEAPIRMRANSPRCLVLYRAAAGQPAKAVLAGRLGKVEVLGRGQQFVAFGLHPSGVALEWFPEAPGIELVENLPAVPEEGIAALFAELAPLLDAEVPVRVNGHDRVHEAAEPQAEFLRVAKALADLPNAGPADWEWWNRVGMATWAATAGSAAGGELFDAWSARHPAYDQAATGARWRHYPSSPPTSIGAGTLFHLAREARDRAALDDVDEANCPVDATEPAEMEEGYWASVLGEAGHAVEREPEPGPGETFPASPLDWDAMVAVPPREWVYGHFLIKRFISVLGAPGGTGKTAYAFAVGLCIATGVEFLGEPVHEPGNIWIYNLEDPKDELYRRFNAAVRRYGVSRSEIEGRVFLDSGRDRELVIAKSTRDGGIVVSPVVKQVIAEIKARNIKVMIVDPFVRSHRLEENVNEQIDFAAALWGQVADLAGCAILLLHHFRKGGMSGDAAAFRGASALVDAARSAISLSPMSADEAEKLGVSVEDQWQFVRVDNAKLNLAPPPSAALWFKLVGNDLDNQTTVRPADRVQTVERWNAPATWDDMPWPLIIRVLDAIEAGCGEGEYYSLAPQAKERWAGSVLVEAGKGAGQAKAILRAWHESGVLEEGQYLSSRAKRLIGCVRVNQAKVSEMRRAASAPNRAADDC